MSKWMSALTLAGVVAVGLPACATKGFVRSRVGEVNGKVDNLSTSVEETQERTKKNEAAINDVDQKAQAANAAAGQAQQAASAANSAATAAGNRANEVGAKADEIDKASKRLVYTVVLSEDEGQFKFGKTDLPQEAKAKIDEVIQKLMANPNGAWFEIEGHTDNVGSPAINEKIGMERAEAVKKYLYEQYQIPLHKMNVISYGETKPVASNKTKDGRAQNRRVVIRVLA
ncbi:MAG TPA: OmpA family protein [Vicinamibacterales bacterium]|nr:OmpA family protein [Vicinamibacterales bacterium]